MEILFSVIQYFTCPPTTPSYPPASRVCRHEPVEVGLWVFIFWSKCPHSQQTSPQILSVRGLCLSVQRPQAVPGSHAEGWFQGVFSQPAESLSSEPGSQKPCSASIPSPGPCPSCDEQHLPPLPLLVSFHPEAQCGFSSLISPYRSKFSLLLLVESELSRSVKCSRP